MGCGSVRLTVSFCAVLYRCHVPYSFDLLRFESGSALVRFERLSLPGQPISKGRTVVLRVLNFIEPLSITDPEYDEYIPTPLEGGLVLRNERKHYVPWSCNIDTDGSEEGDIADVLKTLVEDDDARGGTWSIPVAESIIDERPKGYRGGGHDYLVRWQGLGPEMDTWEDYSVLRHTRALRVWKRSRDSRTLVESS